MSSDVEPNFYPLRDGLRTFIKEFATTPATMPAGSMTSALRSFVGGLDLPENDSVVGQLRAAVGEVRDGKVGEATAMLEEVLAEVQSRLPRFRIVLMDETEGWTDAALKAQAGKIWAAYLYDENRQVRIADISPSYEMHYLYCTAENPLPEDMAEILVTHGDGGQDVSYNYCRQIDGIAWDRKQACGKSADPTADDYAALVEAEIEHYKCNVGIQTPRAPRWQDLVDVVIERFEGGATGAAASLLESVVLKLEAMPLPVKDALIAINASYWVQNPAPAEIVADLRQLLDQQNAADALLSASATQQLATQLRQGGVALVDEAALPADLDGSNGDRSNTAAQAVLKFMEVTGGDASTAMVNLLTNMRHLADRLGLDFDAVNTHAESMYLCEVATIAPTQPANMSPAP